MKTINYTEVFASYQGEARFVGVPSIFLRTFGCNFRCTSFGCSEKVEGTHNPEVIQIIKNIDNYKNLDDLPLVSTGCDSYLSVYPEFKRFSIKATIEDLSTKFAELLPHNRWIQPNGNDVHLVITGGEPLLGWQREYPALLANEMSQGLRNVTFETNGTQPLKTELSDFINRSEHRDDLHVTFSVSPKLSASGEKWSAAIKPAVVADYENYGFSYLKFVVETPAHFDEVDQAVAEYRAAGFLGPVYVMPVGGVVAVYDRNEFHVATEALKRGYYFSPRLHLNLFGNQWGT